MLHNAQRFPNRMLLSATSLPDQLLLPCDHEEDFPPMMMFSSSCQDVSVGWYSLAGYLTVKFLGGALTLLRPKRRYYFVLDEANLQLAYFKEEVDFVRKRQPAGNIDLKNCSVTISEQKQRAFLLHAIGGRQYELEADSDQCALAWLQCLQNRGADDANAQSTLKQRSLNGSCQSLPYSNYSNYKSNYTSDYRRRQVPVSFYFGSTETMSSSSSMSSLPSNSEMAAALDSALQCCVDSQRSQNGPQTKKGIVNGSGFYLDETSSIKSNGSDCSLELTMLNGIDEKVNEEDEDASMLSENAKSLQNWIKDWLKEQSNNQSESGEANGQPTRDDQIIGCDVTVQSDETKTNSKLPVSVEKELKQLRHKERCFKIQMQQQNMRIKDLQRQLEETQRNVHQAPELHVKFLQHQNKFLNAEILRLSTKWQGEQGQFVKLTSKITTLLNDLDKFKMDYVSLLQSCVRVTLGERQKESAEVKLYGGDTHKIRVNNLVEEVRQVEPSLPVLENLVSGNGHVDVYGFRHLFVNENMAIHYISTQLHQHYMAQTSCQNRHRWKLHLNRIRRGLANTKETRSLVRSGIPTPYRSAIWRCLVHQKVGDLKLKHGTYYFKNLCSSPMSGNDGESNSLNQKQITLDLLRTMPNNVHFANPTCKGISQLQQVLHAFCIHNPTIGYCQGMNFLTAICLLFLSPEDTFWFLIALTERYFLPSYFDQTLTGVQADQEVLKWQVEQKLPILSEHLTSCDIDLATITLNWFLALFFDSLPFETMLRVWDCFLLEGPKVLFRFAMALLTMHQDALLERSDTMSILKVLKVATKFTYDVEGLTKLAFEGLKPFPRRHELLGRQTSYIKILKEKLRQKEELKAVALGHSLNELMQIGVAIRLPNEDHCLITFGHQDNGRIGIVQNGSTTLRVFDIQFNCRILHVVVSGRTLFISLISSYLVALKFDSDTMQTKSLWEMRLADMALQLLVVHETRLLAALANGSLAVLENCAGGAPSMLELYYIPVGPAPITCIESDNNGQLWCGMGCKVFVFNEQTLDCIEKLVVANSINGNCAAIFDRLIGFALSDRGIWLSVANSSLLQLWDAHHFTCKLLYDISKDCAGLHQKVDETGETHITSLLSFGDTLWIGTVNGYLLLYQISENSSSVNLKLSKLSPCVSLRNSMRVKDTSSKRASNNVVPKNISLPTSDSGDQTPRKVPLANRDSGYSTASSVITNGASASSRRLSQSFPSFDFAALSKRWQSCESLTPPPGVKRIQIPLSEDGDEEESRPLDSPVRKTSGNFKLPKRYTKAANNGSSKPFNETLGRRRQSLGTIGTFQPYLASPEEEYGPPIPPPLTRQRSNSVLMSSIQSPSMEFDDLFFMYQDDKCSNEKQGGLCTSRLNNTDSDWNISDAMLFSAYPELSVVDERSYEAEKYVNYAMKRPTSLEVRRKDLEPVETLRLDVSDGTCDQADFASPSTNFFASSETSSVISCSSVESPFIYSLNLLMRLKISDKAVNNIVRFGEDKKQTVITCAGSFGNSESILVWSPEENNLLWTNEPVVVESSGRPKTNKLQTRRKTLAWFRT